MPEDESSRQWIVEPPRRAQITLQLSVGAGVRLTEEQERAVSELLRALEESDPEVTGHASSAAQCSGKCGIFECPKMSCTSLCRAFTGSKAAAAVGGSGGWRLMGTFGGLA
ncbi:MAG TPA: hypothetical protein VLV86_16750 [Vicinamibacterales bacterium]|nr:hypothetical protein [Vicinamibacterales bacterium]